MRDELAAAERVAADEVARAILFEVGRNTRRFIATVVASANIDVRLLVSNDDVVELLSYRVQEHVRLIKSLSSDAANRIERLAIDSILRGRGNRETAKLLTEIENISKARAKLIARDQASKLNGSLNQFRQEQAGVEFYRWSPGAQGFRRRDEHQARRDKVFAWAKPPHDGHPGAAINCACRAKAVIIWDGEEQTTAGATF